MPKAYKIKEKNVAWTYKQFPPTKSGFSSPKLFNQSLLWFWASPNVCEGGLLFICIKNKKGEQSTAFLSHMV